MSDGSNRGRLVSQTLRQLRRGALQPEDILALAQQAETRRTLIGKLALGAGMLTMRQVFAIVERQSDEHRPFGDTAVELGMLTRTQVDCLLALQRVESSLTAADLLPTAFPMDADEPSDDSVSDLRQAVDQRAPSRDGRRL
jgi:hypothetical protein